MLAKFGVRDELRVTCAKIGVRGVDTQTILSRAELNVCHALATQPIVGEQRRRHRRRVRACQERASGLSRAPLREGRVGAKLRW